MRQCFIVRKSTFEKFVSYTIWISNLHQKLRLLYQIINGFLKNGLGYDSSDSTHLPGALGPVSAYYGCVEAHGCGTLHCHMIVWLQGALNSDQIRERALSGDTDFQSHMIDFITYDCISNKIPSLPANVPTISSDEHHPVR